MTEKLPADFWTAEVPVDPFAMAPEVGAELTKIDAHTAELESIVQQMWKDMTTETKLLDGTEIPERETIEILPRITEEEFRQRLADGFLEPNGEPEQRMSQPTMYQVWADMYAEALKQGRPLSEVNEEFTKLCQESQMKAMKRDRDDLTTPHKCSAVPVVSVPSENEQAPTEEEETKE